jgi:hypothetical protein
MGSAPPSSAYRRREPEGTVPALERLCRYVCRPPLIAENLSMDAAGKIRYRLRRAWRDGTTAIVLDPYTFISRLAALIPRPRTHLLTYHGILAPAASHRRHVVPEPPEDRDTDPRPCHPSRSASTASTKRSSRPRTLWADLLARVFGFAVLTCPCGGRRSLLAFLTDPLVIAKILDHLGLDHARPPPPQRVLDFA